MTHQEIDINYVKRFSLCNCLTVYFPDTYTAHAMTLDVFINKAKLGEKIVLPYADMWPSGYVRAFKIPKKIDTFLFSPFNEAYHPHYMFDDFRCTIGPHEGAIPLKKLGRPIERPTKQEFKENLIKMSQKVNSLWPDCKKKIIIIYDIMNLKERSDAERMIEYDEITILTLPFWPVIWVNDPLQSKPMWCHYSEQALDSVYKRIVKIEEGL